ncbi:5'/3'-nucleotidase SurE [Halanaerobium sp. Z-7514]|uniref:5'-nucleotidase n=1 Tax=Halanaerobium polyolivorans TaxID=2886943 RepID=A0AAW4X1E1_9FIRM|nr:5'/3'-nucleotidase SurE [Halanaerobium polyolivorans]MCC3145636.1 5'/3'-nucleotidase SurE [Halanaerobium polyolivorans]
MSKEKQEKPLVLITNDDGINSPGLKALAEALEPLANLLIAAPKDQQTGMGRGYLKGDNVGRIESKELNINNRQIKAYAVNGSPAQSVAHAVLELTAKKPDYCISGINYGENIGLAYTCSGTLGAAFEADSLGIKSLAFSKAFPFNKQQSQDYIDIDWNSEKFYIRKIFSKIIHKGFPEKTRIFNINFPYDLSKDTEIRITKQAYTNFGVYIKPENRVLDKAHSLDWKINPKIDNLEQDTDIYAVHKDQVVSITPMNANMSVEIDKELIFEI